MDKTTNLLSTTTVEGEIAKAKRAGTDKWFPDSKGRGAGRLFLRAQPTGGRWYFRYTLSDGKRDTLALGEYARQGRTKNAETGARYTLQGARDEAIRLGSMLKRPETSNIRATLAAIELATANEHRAELARAEAQKRELESKSNTLARLADLYADHLDAAGRVSAKKVRADLRRHVTGHAIAQRPAREIHRRDIAALVREIAEGPGPRIAGMVRSYLRAAFALAISADANPKASAALVAFNVETNPVQDVKVEGTRARSRVLTAAEMRAFMVRLRSRPGAVCDALLCCLLAGGQRPQQLLRATVADFDSEAATLRLRDAKGKRAEPRVHVVPLAPTGASIVAGLANRSKALGSPYLFTSAGPKPIDVGTLSWRVTEISRAMVEAGEAAEPFQMKDLRRTVETLLAGLAVSKDVRAQLLSHGLSGIQSSTYDLHAYTDEKRQALVKWERRLYEIESGKAAGKVVPMRRKA